MAGLLALLVLGLWAWACVRMTKAFTRAIANRFIRIPSAVAVFAALLVLPFADELIAGRQFEALCRDGAVLHIDKERIKGRKIKLAFNPSNDLVPGMLVPVLQTKVHFTDAETGELLGSYGKYTAKSGFLIRIIGFSPSTPLAMRSYCAPSEGSQETAARFGFQIIN